MVWVQINPHHSLLGRGEGIKQYMMRTKNGKPTTTRDGDNIYCTSNIVIILMLENNFDNIIINYDYIITPTTVSIQEQTSERRSPPFSARDALWCTCPSPSLASLPSLRRLRSPPLGTSCSWLTGHTLASGDPLHLLHREAEK